MTAALLIAIRLVLSAVFALAALAKLFDRPGTSEAVTAFGAPEAAAPSLALAIPAAELTASILLLPRTTAVAGASVALGLLLVFSAAIAVSVARGRAPDCHCFGQLHSAPAGPKTLARNTALAAGAVLVIAVGAGPSAVAWVGRLHDTGLVAFVSGIVLLALLAAGAAAFATLLRSYGRVLLRVDRLERALRDVGAEVDEDVLLEVLPPSYGLAPGTLAPAFEVSDLSGARVTLDQLLAPRLPLLLMFTSPRCAPCSALLPHVAEWQRDLSDRLTVAVAGDGSVDDLRPEAEELALDHVLLDEGGELYGAFEANGTPGAVIVGPDGRIASHVASGRDAIEALLDDLLEAPGVPVGAAAPIVELVTLEGSTVTLGGVAERDSLVLFWNPDCGFCRAMYDELLAWERSIDGRGAALVVVSSGDPERTRQEGFASTVALDPEFSAGDALGVSGTPSAVVLAADGRIASGVAVGAQAVLALARAAGPRAAAFMAAP